MGFAAGFFLNRCSLEELCFDFQLLVFLRKVHTNTFLRRALRITVLRVDCFTVISLWGFLLSVDFSFFKFVFTAAVCVTPKT